MQDVVVGDEAGLADAFEAFTQRARIGVDLFRCEACELGCGGVAAIKVVLGGDDVLDGGAVFRLLQGQRADEDGLVRHDPGRALEFGQRPVSARKALQDRLCFQVEGQRQKGDGGVHLTPQRLSGRYRAT